MRLEHQELKARERRVDGVEGLHPRIRAMELEIGKEKRFWQDVQLVASAAELGQPDSRTCGRLVY